MPNVFLKAPKIAKMALDNLEREIVLGGLVTTYGLDDFKYAKDDTLTIKTPARATARGHALRATGSAREIVSDQLAEGSLTVTLNQVAYHAAELTSEEQTLDLANFQTQILKPQMEAIARELEEAIYDEMEASNYHTDNQITWDVANAPAFQVAVDARKRLRKKNVPNGGWILLVGPEAEAQILTDERLDSANPAGLGEGALRDATIGRFAGFTVVTSNLVADNRAFAFHPSAFGLATVAPALPQSLTAKATLSQNNFALRWTADYDAKISTERSVVMSYYGVNSLKDGPLVSAAKTQVRAVKITLT